MSKPTFRLLVMASMLGTTGCVTLQYSFAEAPGASEPTVTRHQWHFLWGLFGNEKVKPACPAARPTVARVDSHLQGWGFLTLGIVTLTTVDVYCQ